MGNFSRYNIPHPGRLLEMNGLDVVYYMAKDFRMDRQVYIKSRPHCPADPPVRYAARLRKITRSSPGFGTVSYNRIYIGSTNGSSARKIAIQCGVSEWLSRPYPFSRLQILHCSLPADLQIQLRETPSDGRKSLDHLRRQ